MFGQDIVVFIKQHIFLSIVWISLIVMIIYTTVMNHIQRSFEISCDKAVFLINKRNAKVVDIRNQREFCLGCIMNSINIPLNSIADNSELLGKKCKNSPLIIIHDHRSSYFIKQYFSKFGFLEVYVLKGGISSWKDHSLPVISKKL